MSSNDVVKTPRRVQVEWTDARSVYEQMELSQAIEKCQLSRRYSLGYLIHRDKERIIIAHTFDPAERKVDRTHTPDEDQGADFTIIPRGWVVAILDLSLGEESTPE